MRVADRDPNPAEPSDVRRDRALELLAAHEPELRRTARRVSLCADDADDAFGQSLEILLTKAPVESTVLVAWMHVVVRREALAVRRARERLLSSEAEQRVAHQVVSQAPEPAEVAEHRERRQTDLRRLAALKPDEQAAIVLQARGFSYAEICSLRGWTYTKVNRCLAEGRARLRRFTPTDDAARQPRLARSAVDGGLRVDDVRDARG